ncbi:probable disease resistance protein At4g19060 [Cannabis sativa]|uniref:probable disease resistance protein At4g19060 n=1 Tax=Cannabis sativa TaxID=3483 RepID=UPI0029CA0D01|nr:probable disease resistance protein At4g19060 [Cannabis sativa]
MFPAVLIKSIIKLKRKGVTGKTKTNSHPETEGNSKIGSENVQSHGNKEKYDVEIEWTPQLQDSLMVRGLENDILAMNEIFERLEINNDNRLKVVGIVGERGVGKTRLCQEYFNVLGTPDVKCEKLFVPRIWVSVRGVECGPDSTPVIKNDEQPKETTMKKMLESVGVDIDTYNLISTNNSEELLKGLLYLLRLQLIGKRYLIVLDDLTSFPVKDACDLVSELPQGYKGTIMVTSREENIVKEMAKLKEQYLHRLLPLSDPQSLWMIFKDAVTEDVKKWYGGVTTEEFDWEKVVEKDLKKKCYDEIILSGKNIDVKKVIEKTLISRCNGIPLAAKLMADTMSQNIKTLNAEKKKYDQVYSKSINDSQKNDEEKSTKH